MEENVYSGWEKLDRLGEGGQSEVFLARSPGRVQRRDRWIEKLASALHEVGNDGKQSFAEYAGEFAMLAYDYARPETDDELGALKIFKMTRGGSQSSDQEIQRREIQRFQNELAALKELSSNSGILTLLAHSEEDFWILTEYMREGSLERTANRKKFGGNALLSLKAFRSVVATVKLLHDKNLVHRDIKPANVFVRKINELVLGDMGIVFVPEAKQRATELGERVGPRD